MSVAAPLVLRPGDESALTSMTRSSTVEAGLAQRARIVLLVSQGVSNTAIAEMVGVVAADGDRLANPVHRWRGNRVG